LSGLTPGKPLSFVLHIFEQPQIGADKIDLPISNFAENANLHLFTIRK
jgi:hypothetical protein